MNDSLSIVIPSAGRASLEHTLRSYAHQLGPDDEVLVVGDTTDGDLPLTREIVARFDGRFRYVDGRSEYHSWGHEEINVGQRLAAGAWVLGNDDDDIATPDALAHIRAAIAEQPHPRPMLFQFMTFWRQVLWAERALIENTIGGHSLVQPNDPERLAYMTPRYAGDFDWIVQAVENYGGDVAWIPRVIAWTRPTADELARLIPQEVMA